MGKSRSWDPFIEWKDQKIKWIKVNISNEDMKLFTKRSNLKGFIQLFSFLFIIAITASFSYYNFANHNWILLAVGLYLHGMIYVHFGDGIHELIHNTVFSSKSLNKGAIILFGLLNWTYNPYLYRASHVHFHHHYTLYQNSDGEDTPNYVELNFKTIISMLFNIIHIKLLFQCIGRLVTLKPTSKNWRMKGYNLDKWEKFIIEKAPEKEKKQIYNFAVISLVFQVVFVTVCILSGYWFLIILITLAPFYGPSIHGYVCGIHQHACCKANNPDFRLSCGDVILDPISSILYWHMEFHIEHHMFAGIPCYNLKKFSRFVADQLPKKENAIIRLVKLSKKSKEIFGSQEQWRKDFGYYKGLKI